MCDGDLDHDEPGNPRLCGTAKTPACGEHVFELVTAPGDSGPWRIVAHATDLARGCDGRSDVLVVEP